MTAPGKPTGQPNGVEVTSDPGLRSPETIILVKRLVLVCLVASLGGLLFGFDTAVISGTVEQVRNQYQLTSLMEGWFTSSALVGCIMGAPIGGISGDRYGRKPTLLVSAVLFFISALYSMLPQSFAVLLWARWIGGVGVGMASVVAPMYVSEFAPPKWRGRMVATYQLSIVVGILLAYYSNWLILEVARNPGATIRTHAWLNWILVREYWRGMFGAECLPAVLFFAMLWLVPESPRWLLQAHQRLHTTEARASGAAVAGLLSPDSASWRELLRPGVRRALLVGVMLSVFGQLSGVNIIVYYGPRVLSDAGYEAAAALLGQVGFGFINLVFTVIAWFVIDRWGRRPLLIGGMAIVTASLGVVGALFYFGNASVPGLEGGGFSPQFGAWIGVILCVYVGFLAVSICAVIWVLTPEIFPNRIRGRGTAVATFANWSTNAVSALLFPWYVQTLGMHVFFITTAFICATATFFFWRFVPETSGRSLEELEKIWHTEAG